MNNKKQFKPQNLRSVLGTLLGILIIGGGTLFYLGMGIVSDYAVEVNHRLSDAEASGNQIKELQLLKKQLAQSNSLVDKANQLFSTPENYQAQALTDVKKYADAAGLSIASTSFGEGSGPGSHTISLSFSNPASYSKIINFLDSIEGNLPKMQVNSITLGHVVGGGKDSVDAGETKINISVR